MIAVRRARLRHAATRTESAVVEASGISIDIVADVRAALGESPIWDPERQELIWVEIDAGRFHVGVPATGEDRSYELGGTVAVAVPCAEGDFLVAREHDAVF